MKTCEIFCYLDVICQLWRICVWMAALPPVSGILLFKGRCSNPAGFTNLLYLPCVWYFLLVAQASGKFCNIEISVICRCKYSSSVEYLTISHPFRLLCYPFTIPSGTLISPILSCSLFQVFWYVYPSSHVTTVYSNIPPIPRLLRYPPSILSSNLRVLWCIFHIVSYNLPL